MIGGAGSVQTLTTSGSTDLPPRPGDVVGFTPGTIHRLVNGGDPRLALLARNCGLPEAGDAVLTFPAPVPADLDVYRRTAHETGRQLERLKAGDLSRPDQGAASRSDRLKVPLLGMCGRLHSCAPSPQIPIALP
ncbi:hypothetical protein [Streptomyces sp. NPDC006477]|uniref:hypothetical protein n=1 Tax=Streptomyces sp. NPDC006477 TaxID=3364747 RepID=UPI003698C3E0